jgi:hypothetical protein
MNPEQQRIAIAEACGWTAQEDKDRFWRAVDASGDMTHELWLCERNVWFAGTPDYLNDLNAMHEAEKMLTNEQWWLFVEFLTEIRGGGVALCISATATQRAEAFLKTLNLWKQ